MQMIRFHDHGASGALRDMTLSPGTPPPAEWFAPPSPAPTAPHAGAGTLLSVRSATILTLALLVSVIAGALSYLSTHAVPDAVLVGGGAGAAAVALLHAVLGH